MTPQALIDTARTLVSGDRELLEMDECNPTPNKLIARLEIHRIELMPYIRLFSVFCDVRGKETGVVVSFPNRSNYPG